MTPASALVSALEGLAVSGYGVSGASVFGIGVIGETVSSADDAIAIYGEIATVDAGSFSAAVRGHNNGVGSDGIGMSTIQGNVADLYVRGVTIASGVQGSFTIHLSRAVKSDTKIAWLAVN